MSTENVEAGGAIVSRRLGDGSLEVCLIHRPKYDDWSFPKGKLETHETHAHAAVREVEEETGIPIRLSALLGEVTYTLHADGSEGNRRKTSKHKRGTPKTKHIMYWVGIPLSPTAALRRQHAFGATIQQDHEADNVSWLSFTDARKLLTYVSDKELLDKFQAQAQAHITQAATVIIVRHGKAELRKNWFDTEFSRPLTPQGGAASFALSRQLACFGAARLISSPWTRCMQTLLPFAVGSHLEITPADEISEEPVEKAPDSAVKFFVDSLSKAAHNYEEPMVLCTHRPVLEKVFPELAQLCATTEIASLIPSESPYLQTAYGLALSVNLVKDEPTITAIQKVEPLVY